MHLSINYVTFFDKNLEIKYNNKYDVFDISQIQIVLNLIAKTHYHIVTKNSLYTYYIQKYDGGLFLWIMR